MSRLIANRLIAVAGAGLPVAEKGLVTKLLRRHAVAVDRLVAKALCGEAIAINGLIAEPLG